VGSGPSSGELDPRALAEETARWMTGGVDQPPTGEETTAREPGQEGSPSAALRANPDENIR
jgi:hypothetical protein